MFFSRKKSIKDLDCIGKVSTFAAAFREKRGVPVVLMRVRSTKGCRSFIENGLLKNKIKIFLKSFGVMEKGITFALRFANESEVTKQETKYGCLSGSG